MKRISYSSVLGLMLLTFLVLFTSVSIANETINGKGNAASFAIPCGVAVDSLGNVYVADSGNNMIRKISPKGVVTTLAGSGVHAFKNGTGTNASFARPEGVAVDPSGNVYVSDTDNNMIRKITNGGVVTTLAGSLFEGYVNGTTTKALFRQPRGIAIDSSGNLYVVVGINIIRKITPSGVVTTFAGGGSMNPLDLHGKSVRPMFNQPFGVAVDSSGNVYVGDAGNYQVKKITSDGLVTTLAGSGRWGFVDGKGTAASFFFPSGVAVDFAGCVYVADSDNSRIRKIATDGEVTTFAGSEFRIMANGKCADSMFCNPVGIAVDSLGNVYVADEGNYLIKKITSDGVVTTLAGSWPPKVPPINKIGDGMDD